MNILVCIDDSPESHKALQRAVELSDAKKDELVLVTVAEPNYADPVADDAIRQAHQGVEISFHQAILDKVAFNSQTLFFFLASPPSPLLSSLHYFPSIRFIFWK